MRKKFLAYIMTVCMLAGSVPVTAVAAVGCGHHDVHTADCGYQAAVVGADCTHTHGEDCYAWQTDCKHEHDADCGYAEATEETEAVACGHSCDADCEVEVLNCGHEHDADCGYVAAVEGADCTFVCEECAAEESTEEEETVCDHSFGAWDWDEEEETFFRACEDCDEVDEDESPAVIAELFESEDAEEVEEAVKTARDNGIITRTVARMLLATLTATELDENTDDAATVVKIEPDYSWYDAAETTFAIDSVEDLVGLANITKGADGQTKDDFNGKTVKLTADITFADNQYWYYNDGTTQYDYCIGTFAGTFDGAVAGSTTNPVETHTITGLKGNKIQKVDATIALFKEITATGCVKNLALKKVTVDISHEEKTINKLASIVYALYGTATNCHVDGAYYTVAGYLDCSGGMFGTIYSSATVEKCTAKNVYITILDAIYWNSNNQQYESDNGQNTGGFVGRIYGSEDSKKISECSIENVYFDCTYKLKKFGGFVGYINNRTMENCTATNVNFEVDDYIYWIGGFVGSANLNSNFNNCDVNGIRMDLTRVSNTATRAGGFIGTTEGTPINFVNCDVTDIDITMHIRANSPIGGFAGDLRHAVSIENCTTSGKIDTTDTSADSAAIGGFIGSTSAATIIKNSSADVDVTANGNVGGFAGDAKNLTVENCHTYGDVTSINGSAGGFAGVSTGNSTLTGCTATGSVESTNGMAGGLVGYINSDANVTFGEGCTPAGNVTGVITGEVANDPEKNYIYNETNKTITTESYLYNGTVGDKEIGFNSIPVALATGATAVTLLADSTESFVIPKEFTAGATQGGNKTFTLNLGEFTFKGEISVEDGTFTVPDGHDTDKNHDDIRGVAVAITGSSTGNDIVLTLPVLDHHGFLGWCYGIGDVTYTDAEKAAGEWKAVPGNTYHAHWLHSSYNHLTHQALHRTLTIAYGQEKDFEALDPVEFVPSTEGDHKILSVDEGDYFTADWEGLAVTLTPKADVVSQLDVNKTDQDYVDTIHVTVEDGSVHSITATVIVTKTDSVITPAPEMPEPAENEVYEYVVGDEITLVAEVTKANATRNITAAQDEVIFYCDDVQLGEPVKVEDRTVGFPQKGIARLEHIAAGTAPFTVGDHIITAEYGGSVNLYGSNMAAITIRVKEMTQSADGSITVGGVTAAPPAGSTDGVKYENNNVVISGGSSVKDEDGETATIPSGVTVTVPAGKLDRVDVADGNIILPADSVVEIGDVEIKAQEDGAVVVNPDGTVEIADGKTATVIVNGNEMTVTGPAAVDAEGNITVTGNGTVQDGDVTVTAPVTVENDGDIVIGGGAEITDGDKTFEVAEGTEITLPSGTLDNVTINDSDLILPNGTTVTTDKGEVTLNNGGKMDADGNVTTNAGTVDINGTEVPVDQGDTVTPGTETVIPEGGKVEVGTGSDKVDITVPNDNDPDTDSQVTVKPDGTVEVPKDTTVTVGGTTVTGPAEVGTDENGKPEVTVGTGGSIGGVTVPGSVGSVTVPVDKLGEVTESNGEITLPEGSKVEIGTDSDKLEIEATEGSIKVDKNTGSVTVPEDGKITVGDTTITGPATVDKDGNITAGDKEFIITTGDTTIKLPVDGKAGIDADGSVTVPEGATVTVNGTKYTVESGTVTVNPDGSVTIPSGTVLEKEDGTKLSFPYGGSIDEAGSVTTNRKPGGSGGSSSKRYSVSASSDVDNGTVTVSPSNAKAGSTVTITVTPDAGYELDKLTVTDKNGNEIKLTDNGDGTYSFKMPKSKVEIDAEFAEIEDAFVDVEQPKLAKEAIVLTIGSTIVSIDGEYIVNDVAPIIKDSRTMLPIRVIAEALGATVAWDADAQKVTITKGETVIEIFIGQPYALVNGTPIPLDAPAFIENSRTYLPLRFIAENLGATVLWDDATKKVTIIPAK